MSLAVKVCCVCWSCKKPVPSVSPSPSLCRAGSLAKPCHLDSGASSALAPPLQSPNHNAAGTHHGNPDPGKDIRELTPDQPPQCGCGHNLQIHERGQQRRRGALIGLDLQQMAQTAP